MTTIEWVMMTAFILALLFSGWKLYAFMPTEPLKDDDTDPASTEELRTLMYEVIHAGELTEEAILAKMKEHPKFDSLHYWRFNHNRLRQLLHSHYLKHPHHQTIEHIHQHLRREEQSKKR